MKNYLGIETIGQLVEYYLYSRGAGHSTLLIQGAKSFDGQLGIVTASQQGANNFASLMLPVASMTQQQKISYLPLFDLKDRLRGVKIPIAVDNHALHELFSQILQDFRSVKDDQNLEIVGIRREHANDIARLKATLELKDEYILSLERQVKEALKLKDEMES